ncbi:MAG: adenylate/guanylate cyclase domain-containing protein [Bacteroidales bacterium]
MKKHKDSELLIRIARLVKHNKDLNEQVRNLSESNDQLAKLVEEYEWKLSRLNSGDQSDCPDHDISRVLKFKMGTVLYADIQGFGKLNDQADTQGVMDGLDGLFLHFDSIVKKYRLEKIKTIGDSYMCAGGVPVKNSTNPIDVVMAALEMNSFLGRLKSSSDINRVWDIRIGIHTGSVTAISTGKKKVSWEFKGDTVNIASRLASSCDIDRINISANTYELIKEFFTCEYNGRIPVKYTDNLPMYYVKGIVPGLSVGDKGILPNNFFDTKFKLIQFVDLQEIILDKLEKELPSHLYYHNVKHTIDVVTEVELIGWAEGISEEEILLLKTAALFHDAGHIRGYDNHEYLGCQLAGEYLKEYNFSPEQIEKINNLIMATKMPPKPTSLLEKIICDSDLDYLGRSDFIPVSNNLFEELKEQNKIGSLSDWNKLQIKFISGHQYFTETARNLREVNKQRQIERIKQLVGKE